jgi:hypothetical protein
MSVKTRDIFFFFLSEDKNKTKQLNLCIQLRSRQRSQRERERDTFFHALSNVNDQSKGWIVVLLMSTEKFIRNHKSVILICKGGWRQIRVFSRTIRPITCAKNVILCVREISMSSI